MKNDTISGNFASGNGAGLYSRGSNNNIINIVFSGNKAIGNGGAIYDSASSPYIVNCTLAGDTATNGNALYNMAGSSPAITNCIIWEGAASGLYNINNSNPTITYGIVQGGYIGTGNSSADPLFVAALLASSAPTTGGNYQIMPCSPAVNAGYNIGSYTSVTDLAGNPRLVGAIVDRGAYEYQGTFPPAITGNNTVCVNATLQLGNTISGGTWSSSNAAVATVSSTGLVTGVAAGTATITYTSTGACNFTVTKSITVNALPAVPSISSASSICVGGTFTLSSSTSGGVWSITNSAVATISTQGNVLGVSAGTDTVYYVVTNTNGCQSTASTIITVNPLPVVAAITGNSSVCANSTTTFSNTTTGGTYSSNNTGVAVVNSINGVVTGISAGTANITYTVTNGNNCTTSVTKSITVNPLPSVAGLSGNYQGCQGIPSQLTTTTTGGTWSSSQPGVATINQSGLITPVAAGTFTISYSVTGGNGCTNASTILFTVGATYNNTTTATTCAGTPYNFGGQPLNTAGTYNHLFSTTLGCDSAITLTLTITTVNTGITQAGNTLTAALSSATYQWINCNGNVPITGATAQSFTPTANGQYAVIVTQNGCTQTSACKTVTASAIAAINGNNEIQVYPNPTSGFLTVANGRNIPSSILLKDITGKILQHIIPAASSTQLNVSGISQGIYLVEVYDADGSRYTAHVSVVH